MVYAESRRERPSSGRNVRQREEQQDDQHDQTEPSQLRPSDRRKRREPCHRGAEPDPRPDGGEFRRPQSLRPDLAALLGGGGRRLLRRRRLRAPARGHRRLFGRASGHVGGTGTDRRAGTGPDARRARARGGRQVPLQPLSEVGLRPAREGGQRLSDPGRPQGPGHRRGHRGRGRGLLHPRHPDRGRHDRGGRLQLPAGGRRRHGGGGLPARRGGGLCGRGLGCGDPCRARPHAARDHARGLPRLLRQRHRHAGEPDAGHARACPRLRPGAGARHALRLGSGQQGKGAGPLRGRQPAGGRAGLRGLAL